MTAAAHTATPPSSPTTRSQLIALTAAKAVANAALRWVGPFLPTLERAFGASTGTLTGIIGVAELGGLSTGLTGRHLDRGRERSVFTAGLLLVALSSLVALGGYTATFALSFVVLILGVGNLTVAGHAWIGHRVPFASRGRAIGVYETSWAISLLVGAPIIAWLIRAFGWRGPYIVLAVAAVAAAGLVLRFVAAGVPLPPTPSDRRSRVRLPRTAWFPMIASAATAAAGLGTFVVSGAWLDDAHGVSTAGLGVVAAAAGAIELASSSGVALIGDRVGARRSVLVGLVLLLAGLAVMAWSGDSRALAVTGLVVFLCGFEYGFVSSLTLVSEAAPAARGRALGIANAIGTVARSSAVIASGQLYESFGIRGTVTMAAAAAVVALACTAATSVGDHRSTGDDDPAS